MLGFTQPPSLAKNFCKHYREQEAHAPFPLTQTKEPFLSRFELLLERGEIDRVGEIAGAEEINPFPSGPPGEAFGLHLAATGVAEARVNVKVGDNAHRRLFPPIE